MENNGRLKVLFTGHAPVHFLCFYPLYEQLRRLPGVELFVSGGLELETDAGVEYDTEALYLPFGLPEERMMSVAEIRQREFDVFFAANTNPILPQRAGIKIQIFHGISFRNRAVRLQNMGKDFYFMTGPYMNQRFIEAGLFEEDDRRAVPIGFMKTDRLLNGGLNRSELLTRHGFDGSRPLLLYAPTGEKYNSLEIMGEEVVERLIGTGKYDLVIKPHDHPKKDIDWFGRLERFEGDHCRVAREFDIVPLLHLADLLISDASSVSNEYSLLDRPMVFLDAPKLLRKARLKKGSSLDLDTWGRKCGLVVSKAEDVEEAVETSLRNPKMHSAIRRAMAKDLFYNPGKATDAAMAWLGEHVLESPPAADLGSYVSRRVATPSEPSRVASRKERSIPRAE